MLRSFAFSTVREFGKNGEGVVLTPGSGPWLDDLPTLPRGFRCCFSPEGRVEAEPIYSVKECYGQRSHTSFESRLSNWRVRLRYIFKLLQQDGSTTENISRPERAEKARGHRPARPIIYRSR